MASSTIIKQLLADIKEAKETPSETCIEGMDHEFNFILHADGRDSFSNYFRCLHCREIVVRTQSRTGIDKRLWEAE